MTVAAIIPARFGSTRFPGKLLARRLFGLTLREVTPRLARELRLPMENGLMVVGIDAGGPADRIRLRLKDVIFQVDNYYVVDLESLGILLEDVKPDQRVRVGVARGTVAAWVHLRARRAPTTGPRATPKRRPGPGGEEI